MDKSFVEKITDLVDLLRKAIISVLVFVLSIFILVLFIRNSGKNRVVVQPFQLSGTLMAKGYTGEMMTALFVQRIKEMQDSGRSFYLKNKAVIPSWDDKVNDISAALSESMFGEVKSLLEYFAGANAKTAAGQVALIDTTVTLVFTYDGEPTKFTGGGDINAVLNQAAEDALHHIDPYILASYYHLRGEDVKCLQIAQELLNDVDTAQRGLANHLRGLAYLQLRDTLTAKAAFLLALRTIKSPWMTLNNLGVIYDHYSSVDSASWAYRRAIALKPDAYPAYLNYANELYVKRYPEEKSMRVLDSSLLLYRKAIANDPQEPMLYLALLPAIYDKGDTIAATYYKSKVQEMAPDNYLVYFQIGTILKKRKQNVEAGFYFEAAEKHCHGDSLKIKQIDAFSRRP